MRVSVPEPAWVSERVPLTLSATVTFSLRSKSSEALSVKSPVPRAENGTGPILERGAIDDLAHLHLIGPVSFSPPFSPLPGYFVQSFMSFWPSTFLMESEIAR